MKKYIIFFRRGLWDNGSKIETFAKNKKEAEAIFLKLWEYSKYKIDYIYEENS